MIKPKKTTRLIIFDFDDTLEDYSTAAKACTRKMADYFYANHKISKLRTRLFIRHLNRKYVHYGMQTHNPKSLDRTIWFQDYSDHFNLNLSKREIKKIVDFYWKITLDEVKLFNGAESMLKELKKDKSNKLIILSDSDGNKKIKMDRINKFKIAKYFNAIITSDDTKTNKPSQNNYFYIFKKFNVLPKDCVMLGDKPEFDLLPAKKLGMTTIWVRRGWWARMAGLKRFRYADYSVKELRAIPKILKI